MVSRDAIDKLEVYRGLGVREVWKLEGGVFTPFSLRGDAYVTIERSDVLPEVDLARLLEFASWPDSHQALKAYRDELRSARA